MIRRAVYYRDRESIVRLIRNELLPFTRRSFPGKRFSNREMRARIKKRDVFVVAGHSGYPIGFIMLQLQDHIMFIDMLAVDRHAHGKGWGTALMKTAERYGIRRGMRVASLYVDVTNSKAMRFYERRGYVMNTYIQEIKCYLYTKTL